MGRFYAFFTFSLRPSDIKRPPHLRSFTSVVASTNHGVTWGYPVSHSGKSWTQPSSYYYASSILHGRRPYFYHTCGSSKSSSHVGSRPWSNSGYSISYWTWSCQNSSHNPSPGSVQTTGLLNCGPTTEEETKSDDNSRNSSFDGYRRWPSWPTSHHIRGNFWRPQLRWLRLWRSIRSCFRSWPPRYRPQLPPRHSCKHHLHHSTRYLHSHPDTKPKGTTVSNLSGHSTKSGWSTSWPTISPMDQRRWSRADQHETGHKVPSFVEDDRGQTSSRSSGV